MTYVQARSNERGVHTAAVCGDVFASPNANQVKRALQLVENEKGYVCFSLWYIVS
jgi:dihydroxyacetone kinase